MDMTTHESTALRASISHPARQPLPLIWPGYVLAFVLLLVDLAESLFDPSSTSDLTPLWLLLIVVYVAYWAFCIYRIHSVLRDISGGLYPISPAKATGFHFIPFYNLYWVVHWPNCLADFLNSNSAVRMPRFWPGLCLLVGILVGRFAGEIGCLIVFSVLLYLVRKVNKVLPA